MIQVWHVNEPNDTSMTRKWTYWYKYDTLMNLMIQVWHVNEPNDTSMTR